MKQVFIYQIKNHKLFNEIFTEVSSLIEDIEKAYFLNDDEKQNKQNHKNSKLKELLTSIKILIIMGQKLLNTKPVSPEHAKLIFKKLTQIILQLFTLLKNLNNMMQKIHERDNQNTKQSREKLEKEKLYALIHKIEYSR